MLALLLPLLAPRPQEAPVVVPRLWDEEELRDWALPLAGLGEPPSFLSSERYYAFPVDNLRTYPVYHPDFEPEGYREGLVARGPQPLIRPEELRTVADWIAAGERVFAELDTALSRTDDPDVIAHFTSGPAIDAWRDATHDVMARDGTLLDYRWVVGLDGKLRLGLSSCAGCHTRLMPDGSLLAGAPSNYDISSAPAVEVMLAPLSLAPGLGLGEELYAQFGVPWLEDDPHLPFKTASDEELGAWLDQDTGAPPGTTFDRFNGSPFFTTRMADLRGIAQRRFLDATATHRNRGPADVARYAILVEFAESSRFGPHEMLPTGALAPDRPRPPDEAMYALALYLYSLEPAPSPYPRDARAQRGETIFREEGCIKCHTPPAYTNNRLVRAPGFERPDDERRVAAEEVVDRRVGTDPGLALRTRKGTGYYKVPSLRGLWYRGLYAHDGSVASLEDWFDPRRLEPDHVPSGWRGRGVRQRAVPGHEFGLDLEPEEKAALIAFLLTL